MRRIEKKANGENGTNSRNEQIIIEQFNSFGELLRVTDSRTQNFGDVRKEMGGSWAKCKSYEEARNFLEKGWNEKIDLMKQSIKKLHTGTSEKISFKNDIVGYAPIVPNAIIGLPHSMINNVRKPKRSKVINVQALMEFNANVDQEALIKWGAKLVNKIVNLENNGFRVKLEYITVFSSRSESGIYICRVPLKNENQPIDLKRLMFPLCHVAMLRIIMFDWYNRLPKAKKLTAYGSALYSQDDVRRDFIINQIHDKDTYFIKYTDDIEETFKEVR